MQNLHLAITVLIALSCAGQSSAVGKCDMKTDGTTANAVTNADCGTGFFATVGATTACAAAPCAFPADRTACCTAVATCDKKTNGGTASAVTTTDCGTGFEPKVGATTACAAAPCAFPADKAACCIAVCANTAGTANTAACSCPGGFGAGAGDTGANAACTAGQTCTKGAASTTAIGGAAVCATPSGSATTTTAAGAATAALLLVLSANI